jgi:hypothetical protein
MRPWIRDALHTLAAGAVVGLLVLGLGGRLAMAAIQLQTAGDSSWSLGGTMIVVFLGGVSGLAGAVMWLASERVARRVGAAWVGYLLLAALLGLVTMRGLRGTATVGAFYFYPLVAVYAVLLVLSCRFLRVSSSSIPASLTSR